MAECGVCGCGLGRRGVTDFATASSIVELLSMSLDVHGFGGPTGHTHTHNSKILA